MVKRKDDDKELARINSSLRAAQLAREKAREYETEVYIEVELHEEEDEGQVD